MIFYKENNMVTENEVLNCILGKTTLGAVVESIPDEYVEYIHSFLSIPFLLEDTRDREWVIYLYIIDTLKWYVSYMSDNPVAMDAAAALLELLDTAFDHKAEYRVERFFQNWKENTGREMRNLPPFPYIRLLLEYPSAAVCGRPYRLNAAANFWVAAFICPKSALT